MLIFLLLTFIHASMLNEFLGNLNAVVNSYPSSYAIDNDGVCKIYDGEFVEVDCNALRSYGFTHKCVNDNISLYIYNYASEVNYDVNYVRNTNSKVKFYLHDGETASFGRCSVLISSRSIVSVKDLCVLLLTYVLYDNPRLRRGYMSYVFYFMIGFVGIHAYRRFKHLL